MICANTRQVSIKKGKKRRWRRSLKEEEKEKEKKRYLHFIKKNKTKQKQTNKQTKQKEKKGKKESKMKINTELVGEKVPENKSCPPSFLAFCKVNYSYLRARYFVYIYIYLVSQIRINDVLFHSFFYVGLIR